MCGRYAASRNPEDLVEEFEIDRLSSDIAAAPLQPAYNVAPTDPVYAVLERRPRDRPEADPERQLRVVRWGLVPSWAKDPSIASRLINARVETVHEKPAFKKAFAARRCIIPADGYYEWYDPDGGVSDRPKKGRRKQPFFIRPRDGGVLAMAGLYELWRDPARDREDADGWVWTCTLLTTSAQDELGRIHDRMPMLVEPGRYDAWLDPALDDPDRLRAVLTPAAPWALEAYPVSTEVSNVRSDGPQLIEPLPVEGEEAAPVVAPAGAEAPMPFQGHSGEQTLF